MLKFSTTTTYEYDEKRFTRSPTEDKSYEASQRLECLNREVLMPAAILSGKGSINRVVMQAW